MPLNIQIPPSLKCPLTQTIMVEPVFYKGYTYERKAIEQRIKDQETNTQQELQQLFSNESLKKEIKQYVSDNKKLFEEELLKAVKQKEKNVVELMIELEIDPNISDSEGWTPLHHAVNNDDVATTQMLLAKNANVNANKAVMRGLHSPPELPVAIAQLKEKIALLTSKNQVFSSQIWGNDPNITTTWDSQIKELWNKKVEFEKALDEGRKQIEQAQYYDSYYREFMRHKSHNACILDGEIRKGYDSFKSNLPIYQQRYDNLKQEIGKLYLSQAELTAQRTSAITDFQHVKQELPQLTAECAKKESRLSQSSYRLFKGLSPVHLATYKKNNFLIQLLLDQGVSIELPDEAGASSLFWAVYSNHLPSLQYLVAQGANLLACDHQGNTLLHAAAEYADPSVIKYLLDREIKHNARNTANQTPADIATSLERTEIANYLIEQGKQQWKEKQRRLVKLEQQAQQSQDKQINDLTKQVADIKKIVDLQQQFLQKQAQQIETLNHQAENEFSLENIVRKAVKNGQVKNINALLKLDIDVEITDTQGLTLLHEAVLCGHCLIASLLLRKAPQLLNIPDKQGQTALHHATQSGNLEMLLMLLQHKADVELMDHQNKTAYELASTPPAKQLIANHMLFNATKVGNVTLAQQALDQGADINAVDTSREINETALHKAAYGKHSDLVEFLIKRGAKPEAIDKYGNTPIQVVCHEQTQKAILHTTFLKAVQAGDIASVHRAVVGGLNINIPKDEKNASALHLAIIHFNNIEMIKTLLDLGADVKAVDHCDQTPLHLAAQSGNQEAAELLLQKDAEPNRLKDIQGHTPGRLALRNGHADLAAFIYEFVPNRLSAPQSSGYNGTLFSTVDSQGENKSVFSQSLQSSSTQLH